MGQNVLDVSICRHILGWGMGKGVSNHDPHILFSAIVKNIHYHIYLWSGFTG